MSERSENNKLRFWTPLRVACTVISLGLLAAFGVSSCNSNDPSTTSRPAAPTRPTTLATLPRPVLDAENKATSGGPIKLSNYSGKVLLVNLWATWCGPCRLETPELVKLHKEFHAQGLEVVGLSTEDADDSADNVREFVQNYKVDYRVGWSGPQVAMALMQGRDAIPQSFIISRDGHVLKRFIGFNPITTPDQIRDAVQEALNQKSAAD